MEGWDPTEVNWFDPPKVPSEHHVDLRPHRVPSQVPEIGRLFAVQRDLVKAVNAMMGVAENSQDMTNLRANLANGYRLLNNYLRTYSSGPEGGTIE